MANEEERIKHIFKYMEHDVLTDAQRDFVISLSDFFDRKGYLTDAQYEPLEDIFRRAAEKESKYE